MKSSMQTRKGSVKLLVLWLSLLTLFFWNGWRPSACLAAGSDSEIEALKAQMKEMSDVMTQMRDKLQELEKQQAEKEKAAAEKQKDTDEELSDLGERMDTAELHTMTDKISLGFEMRSTFQTIHYDDVRIAPADVVNAFFIPYNPSDPMSGGLNGATGPQIQQMIQGMFAAGMVPPPNKFDVDNDDVYTSRFRLNLKAKYNSHLDFAGRLAMYKVWGDSAGVNVNRGSLNDITLDGNTSTHPHGDIIHLERAYINYHDTYFNVPLNFSVGRRPATEGPPLEYRNYSLEGGSPLATIINWQFDGMSFDVGLEDVTQVPGLDVKFCYGVGFEGEYGNSTSMNPEADVNDSRLFGIIATLYNDDVTSAVVNWARAFDVTDGFIGTTVMPFTVNKGPGGVYTFSPNTGGYVSRVEPTTSIGMWDAVSLLLRTNFEELVGADIDFFIAGSWSHTSPSTISKNPFYELMGMGLLSSNGNLESQDGYSIYAGARIPMPLDGKLGLEYNYGSKYWFNFTGAEDSLVGSKLATRGHVFEGYYIQPIYGEHFFLKLSGQYYNYEYSGSGNPLGKPVKISSMSSLDALFPVMDKVWLIYLSATMRM